MNINFPTKEVKIMCNIAKIGDWNDPSTISYHFAALKMYPISERAFSMENAAATARRCHTKVLQSWLPFTFNGRWKFDIYSRFHRYLSGICTAFVFIGSFEEFLFTCTQFPHSVFIVVCVPRLFGKRIPAYTCNFFFEKNQSRKQLSH